MHSIKLKNLILETLEDSKALDPVAIDVNKYGVFTDYIVISSGTSNRHIHSISNAIIRSIKEKSFSVLGVEGKSSEDWVLVDAGDVVIHIMNEEARKFYDLEGLWDID